MEKKLNLQMYAYDPQSAPANNTGSNTLTYEMKEYYDRNLIEEASAELVHDQFGVKKPIPKNGGKQIEFRKFSALPKATTALTEGVTPDGRSLTVTHVEATVAQYGDFVSLTDMLELTAIDNVVLETTKLIGKQAGLTLDTITRTVLQSGNNVSYAPKFVSGTETAVSSRANLDTTARLTVDVIKRAVAKLRAQNAPTFNGDYVAVIHPYAAYDLMSDPAWIDCHKYAAPENLFTGEIGKLAGVRFVETSEAKIYKDTTCPSDGASGRLAVFTTLIIGQGAYGTTEIEGGGLQTIIKQKGSGGTSDPLDQRSTIGWKASKVAELLIPSYLVRVESCSAVYSADTTAN